MTKIEKHTSETRSFAMSLKALRTMRGLSLQGLAESSGISKSMISKVERGDVRPSLDVAVRLAEALGSSVSEMIRRDEYARVIKLERKHQSVASDPKLNWERRLLSPMFNGASLEVLHTKVGARVKLGAFPRHPKGTEEYVVVLKGKLSITIGGAQHSLEEGDSLFFEADRDHALENPAGRPAEYLIIIKH
jgi:transcriptional regulator with XRE-family HTH domain